MRGTVQLTGKSVEARVWAEVRSLLCWVPNPADKSS